MREPIKINRSYLEKREKRAPNIKFDFCLRQSVGGEKEINKPMFVSICSQTHVILIKLKSIPFVSR